MWQIAIRRLTAIGKYAPAFIKAFKFCLDGGPVWCGFRLNLELRQRLRAELEEQLSQRRRQHEKDLARGIAHVPLPDALERKYPNAVKELGWQFLFASRQLSRVRGITERSDLALDGTTGIQ